MEVLKIRPSAAGLKLAISAMQVPEVKEAANQAALTIALKVGGRKGILQLISEADLDRVKLEIIKAEYGAGSTFKDVTAVLRKHAGDLPLIVLPSGKYNTSFGDPLPGGRKQLKIQYRINGKAGRASFAEDALIILPVPK